MSFLDSLIVNGGGIDEAALLELAATVDAQQATIAAQQSALGALQTSITALGATDTTQDAELDAETAARAAADTAHNASIAALEAVDATYGSTITTLQLAASRIERSLGVLIEKYVPGGGALTFENFDASLRAAAAACYAEYDDTGYAAPCVRIPDGNWKLDLANGPVVFPGSYGGLPGLEPALGVNNQGHTPGIIGNGASQCTIIAYGDLPAGRGVFEWGVVGGSWPLMPIIKGFTLAAYSGAAVGSGLRFKEQTFLAYLEDVYVFGFGAAQGYDDGIGIAFDKALSGPHQHIHMHRVSAQGCQLGGKFENCAQFTFTQCHFNQCLWMSVSFSGCVGTWRGGTMQDGDQPLSTFARDNYWFGGTLHPSCSTGYSHVLLSGSGASIATATYATDPDTTQTGVGTTLVSGLSTSITNIHEGMWLSLSNGVAAGSGNIVRGLYQISRYVGPGQVEVLKGTSHPATTGLDYELRAHEPNFIDIPSYIYHEGFKRCMWFLGPNYSFQGEQWSICNQQPQNTMGVLAQNGFGLKLELTNIWASGAPKARIVNCSDIRTNEPFDQYGADVILDDYSRRGMEQRNRFIRRARRLSNYVEEVHGFSWLMKHTDTVTLATGTEVSEWRSRQDSAVKFVPLHATHYCTYVPSDAGFGGPALQVDGGNAAAISAGTYKSMRCTIPSAKLPPNKCFPTLLVIGRLLSTTPDASGVRIVRLTTSDNLVAMQVGVNDATFFPTGVYAVPWASAGGNAPAQPSELATATTDPFAIFTTGDYAEGYNFDGRMTSYGLHSQSVYPTSVRGYYRNVGTDMQIDLVHEYAGTDPFIIAGVVMIPQLPSPAEIKTLRELVGDEFRDVPSLQF